MKNNRFEQIRKDRKRPIYRNRMVKYDGRDYRIAGITSTGGLILRAQVIIHPWDKGLDYCGDWSPALPNQSDVKVTLPTGEIKNGHLIADSRDKSEFFADFEDGTHGWIPVGWIAPK